jgi:predicted nucleic acid-binding protein
LTWLLDTNVVSEIGKRQPDRGVSSWISAQRSGALHISTVTLAEIRFGMEICAHETRKKELAAWLEIIRAMFLNRSLDLSEEILFRWRLLAAAVQRTGKTLPQADALIAATALHSGLRVATRDTAPYILAGVPTFNPWTGESFNSA